MDIECPTCGEPWDTYHMRHDEAHEWGLSLNDLNRILRTGCFEGPDDPARKAAEAAGWEFIGDSLLGFVRCPCCAIKESEGLLQSTLRREQRKAEVVAALEILGDDEDALVSVLSV